MGRWRHWQLSRMSKTKVLSANRFLCLATREALWRLYAPLWCCQSHKVPLVPSICHEDLFGSWSGNVGWLTISFAEGCWRHGSRWCETPRETIRMMLMTTMILKDATVLLKRWVAHFGLVLAVQLMITKTTAITLMATMMVMKGFKAGAWRSHWQCQWWWWWWWWWIDGVMIHGSWFIIHGQDSWFMIVIVIIIMIHDEADADAHADVAARGGGAGDGGGRRWSWWSW